MLVSRTRRTIAAVTVSCALLAGPAVGTAMASSNYEAKYLANMKKSWATSTKSDQVTTCKGYKTDAATVVRLSVASVWKNPDAHAHMTKAGWTRVISSYLKWACSGPGTTPR